MKHNETLKIINYFDIITNTKSGLEIEKIFFYSFTKCKNIS